MKQTIQKVTGSKVGSRCRAARRDGLPTLATPFKGCPASPAANPLHFLKVGKNGNDNYGAAN